MTGTGPGVRTPGHGPQASHVKGVRCGRSVTPFHFSLHVCASVKALGSSSAQARGESEIRGASPMAQPPRSGGRGQKTICQHVYTGYILAGEGDLFLGLQGFDENVAILTFLSMIR